MSRIGRPSCEPPFAGITQVRLLAVDSDIAALSARFPELPRMFGDIDATAKAARGQARRPGPTGSICFARARSRSPYLRMRSLAFGGGSHCHVTRSPATLNEARSRSPRFPDSLASPPAQLAKGSTPRVAGSLVPRLARNLTQYRAQIDHCPGAGPVPMRAVRVPCSLLLAP